MKKMQFITSVHGNEYMPTLALASIGASQVIANPRALARGVRFTEHDLNASFGTRGDSYEEGRARELLSLLDPNAPVVDFHTFSCVSDPFVIVVDLDQLKVARKLGLKNIVYMKHNIKAGHALINHLPGVSVEVGSHTDPTSFDLTIEIVRNIEEGRVVKDVRVYEVFGRIEEKGDYTNFEEKDGFISILYGERAYDNKGFYGLKAREITGTI